VRRGRLGRASRSCCFIETRALSPTLRRLRSLRRADLQRARSARTSGDGPAADVEPRPRDRPTLRFGLRAGRARGLDGQDSLGPLVENPFCGLGGDLGELRPMPPHSPLMQAFLSCARSDLGASENSRSGEVDLVVNRDDYRQRSGRAACASTPSSEASPITTVVGGDGHQAMSCLRAAARMAVNASWPCVSRKVTCATLLSPASTLVTRRCAA